MGLRVTKVVSGTVQNGRFNADRKQPRSSNPIPERFVTAKVRRVGGRVEVLLTPAAQNPKKSKKSKAKKTGKKR